MIVDRYYYGKLTDLEKTVYKEMYQGCMAHADIIPLSVSEQEIANSYDRVTSALTDDNPLLYYLNQSCMTFAKDVNGNVAAAPQYYFSKESVAKYNQKIQDTVNKLIEELDLTEGNDALKVRKVHDYFCKHVTYAKDGSDMKNISKFIAAHNIIGVFAHKEAQCEGIAKAAKVLLNAVDVRCIFVYGKAGQSEKDMAEHSWNIVNISGEPYHLDITFDIGAGSGKLISYDYYNVTESQIRKNHIFSTGYPKCIAKERNYFEENNLVFSAKKKLKNYIEDEIRAGQRSFYFKLAGQLRAKEVCSEMMDHAFKVMCELGQTNAKVYQMVNEDMNTFRISLQ